MSADERPRRRSRSGSPRSLIALLSFFGLQVRRQGTRRRAAAISVWALFHDATGPGRQVAGADRRPQHRRDQRPPLEGALARGHHPHQARDQAVVERDGLQEVGVAARRVLPGDRSRHARVARAAHRQDRHQPPAQGRRADQERGRGGDHHRHPGAGQRDAAGPAADPARRAASSPAGRCSEIAESVKQGVDQQLGGGRAAARPPRPDRARRRAA